MVAGAVLLQRTFVEPLQGACTIPLLHTPWPIVRRPDTEPVLARAGVAGEPQAVRGGASLYRPLEALCHCWMSCSHLGCDQSCDLDLGLSEAQLWYLRARCWKPIVGSVEKPQG